MRPRRGSPCEEEAVDGRAGAADVGAEGSEAAQLVGERRGARSFGGSAARSRGAPDCVRAVEQRRAPLVEPASPRRVVEARVDVGRRVFAAPSREHEHDPVVLRQLERLERRCRRRSPSCGPRLEEERDVGAELDARARARRSSRGAARAQRLVREPERRRRRRSCRRRAPRRPGCACRSSRASAARARGRPRALERAPDERVAREAVDAKLVGRLRASSSVGEVERWQHGRDLVLAVGAPRADDEREVDLRRCAGARVTPARRASATNSAASSSSARTSPARGRSPQARLPPARARRRPRARASSASVLRRWANARLDDPLHAPEVVGKPRCGGTRRARSRRSGAGGRPSARRGGKPVRSRRELDEHRDGAVGLRRRRRRRSGRRPRAAPSRTSARRAGGRRGSRRRAASRRCTAGSRRASSAAGRASRGRAGARRRSGAARSVARRAARRAAGSSDAVELDRVHVARRDRRGSAVRTPSPGPTSSTTSSASSSASRPITPRMFSSTRKCWPSSRSWRAAAHGRPNAACGVRVDLPLRARPASSPRASASAASVWTTLAGSLRLAAHAAAGARYGQSVSASRRSAGTCRAASRRSSAFGYVTLPANET